MPVPSAGARQRDRRALRARLGGCIEVEFVGIGRALAAAVELRALLDGERHMVDIAHDLRGRLKCDRHPLDDAGNLATHDDPLGGHHAGHLARVTDDHFAAAHVTLDLAVNLDGALADDLQTLTQDLEILADYGLREGRTVGRRGGAGAAGRVEAGRLRLARGLDCLRLD